MPDTKDLITEAKKRFRIASDYWNVQKKQEKDDLKFQIPELQWTEEARAQRQGAPAGTLPGIAQAIPARPMLSVDKLSPPMKLIRNQERQAHLGISIYALSEDAEDATAEVLNDIVRKIQRDSNAPLVRSFAFDRAVKAGLGWYRILSEYDDSAPEGTDDQRLVIKRILYQGDVYPDPAAEEPDFCDAEWMFLPRWIPASTCKRLWPDADWNPTTEGFGSDVDGEPQWVRGEGEERAFLVTEYFRKAHSGGKRDRVTHIDIYKVNGTEVLEEGKFLCKYIPLIPVPGEELQPFDGKRKWIGVVFPNRDAQRAYNYELSNAIETLALEPRAPFVATLDQVQGFEAEYQQANMRNIPVLHYNAKSEGGNLLPAPARVQADTGKLGMSLQMLAQTNEDIQSGTSTFAPSLGNVDARHRSGRAIQSLQGQSEASNSNFLQNEADISLVLESKILLDAIPNYYDREARVVAIEKENGDRRTVMLNAPHVYDQRGRPQPVPMAGGDGQIPANVKVYDLSKGRYGVAVNIGKNALTRKQEGADKIGEIIQADPQLMMVFGDIWAKFLDSPDANMISDRLRKAIEAHSPGLTATDDGMTDPVQMRAQLQASQAKIQQLTQMLQQAGQMVKGKQMEQQTQLQGKQLDSESRIKVAGIQAQAGIVEAQIKAGNEQVLAKMQSEFESIKEVINALREQRLEKHAAAHDVALQAQGQAHEKAMAAHDAAHEVAMAALGQKHDAQMGAMQAQTAADAQAADQEFQASQTEPQADGSGE
jgi:hypothetical protein